MLVGKFLIFSNLLLMRHNWRASLKKFCRQNLTHSVFPVALSVKFLLVYAKYNFAAVNRLNYNVVSD